MVLHEEDDDDGKDNDNSKDDDKGDKKITRGTRNIKSDTF